MLPLRCTKYTEMKESMQEHKCSLQANQSYVGIQLSSWTHLSRKDKVHARMNAVASVVSDSVTLWTVAHQAPLFMGFSRQKYWSGLPYPAPGNPPFPGIEPSSLTSNLHWHMGSLPPVPLGKSKYNVAKDYYFSFFNFLFYISV